MKCHILYLVGQLDAGGQFYFLFHSMDRQRYRPAVAVWNLSEADVYVPRIRALGAHKRPRLRHTG